MSNLIRKSKVKAFTLVEVILYVGLFGFIFTTIISFFLVTDEFNKNDKYQIDVAKSALFVVEHLEETFNNAKSIDIANSTFDNNIGILTVVKDDNSTVRYSVSNNRIIVLTSTSNFISPVDIVINKFRFEQVIDNGVIKGVRFDLDISSAKRDRINKNIVYTYVIQ